MSDWRLCGQEKYLADAILYQITFPDFWQMAYREKNDFFRMIERGARQFVKETGRGQEYLEGEKIQHFWHAHCDFCWEKAETDKDCQFYTTRDMAHWVCADCFEDFHEQFKWKVLDGAAHVAQLTEEEEGK